MREDLQKLTLSELCDELVDRTEKLLNAVNQRADDRVLWQHRAEVKKIQLAIREKKNERVG